MSDFPALKPAFTIQVAIDAPMAVGSASRGSPLAIVPMTSGTMKSEPGFSPSISAEFVGVGNDYIHNDPTGKHMRLDAHGGLKTDDGAMIYLNYKGVVDITPELGKILGGAPDAATTPFGNSFVTMTFETGSDKYKELELGVYLGAGHFIVEEGKPVIVEYKVSRAIGG